MARDYYDESKKKKKTVPKKKEQSSSSSQRTVNKVNDRASKSTFLGGTNNYTSKTSGTTKKTYGSSSTPTTQQRQNQKSYGTTKPNVTTRNTPSTPQKGQTTSDRLEEDRKQRESESKARRRSEAQYQKTNARPTAATAEKMMEEREAARRQKSGLNSMATADQQRAANRAVRNTPALVKKAVQDTVGGHKKTIADVTDMTAERGTNAYAMKLGVDTKDSTAMAKVKADRAKTAKEARRIFDEESKKQTARQTAWDNKTKNASGLEKAYYGAVESGTGMLTDLVLGMGTQAGALTAMGSRTYGQTRGQAQREGATQKEDRLYSLAQAGKEVGTELMFPGAGLARRAYGKVGMPLAEVGANALTKRLRGKTADIVGAGLRLAGGVGEENLEEVAGWGLDPIIKEATYGKNLRERKKAELLQGVPEFNDPQEASSASAYLSSGFIEDTAQDLVDRGASVEEAHEIAEKLRDFYSAYYSGDEETMDRIAGELSGAEELSLKKSWNWAELGETIASTTLLTGVTGLPGTVTTASRGSAIRDSLGDEGLRALANYAVDFEDKDASLRGEVARDRMDEGNSLTSTQVYDLAVAQMEQESKDIERVRTATAAATKRMEQDNLVEPYVVTEGGIPMMGEATRSAYSEAESDARQVLEDKESISEEQINDGARAIAGFTTGVFTVNDANALNYSNTEIREAFTAATGVNLSQYVVRDKNGNVNIPATNTATKDALFAMASDNLVKSAEAETVNWMDNVKGDVVTQVSARMSGKGSLALQAALDDVDERNRSEYMMTANAADMMYQQGRNIGVSWNTISKEAKAMFPAISEDKLRMMYEAGLEDREIANNKAIGMQAKMGEKISSTGERTVPGGKVIVETEAQPKGTEIRLFSEIADQLGADIHLVDAIYDKEGNVVGRANGSYDPETNSFYINLTTGVEQNIGYIFMHECTHYLKVHSPEQYQSLENLVREKWFSANPEQMQNAIARKIEAYKAAGQNLTEEQALEEIIADAAHEFINDPNFANQIAEENPSLAKALLDSIRNALRMLRRILSSGTIDDETHMNSLFSELGILDEAEKLWLNAYTQAVKMRADQAINDWQDEVNAESEVRHSISDTDYMDAVERGDMETAQRMVDEAAEAARYNYKAYRGGKVNVFQKEREGNTQIGTFFTSAEYIANAFASGNKDNVGSYYLKMDNPLTLDAEGNSYVDIPVPDDHPDKELVEYASSTYDGTVSADDMGKWADAHGYDGVIINNVKEGIGGDAETDLIAINPEQTKSADPVTYDNEGNVIPLSERFNTANEDVRFSLNEPVERVRDLIAVHNLKPDDIRNTFELGGFPMPSIAITKDSMGHDMYGDITLMFHSDTIDPEQGRDNQVFGGDAYTPVFPQISYKHNEKVTDKIRDLYYEGADQIGYDAMRPLYDIAVTPDEAINRNGGEEGLKERYKDDASMMRMFLKLNNNDVETVVKREETTLSDDEQKLRQYFIDKLGKDKIEEFAAKDIPDGIEKGRYRKQWVSDHLDDIKKVYRDYFTKDAFQFTDEELDNVFENMRQLDFLKLMRNAWLYLETGPTTVKEEIDYDATNKLVREAALNSGYEEWIDNLLTGVEEKKGIRNDREEITNNGRRSWEQLHDEITLENVVRSMRRELAAGGNGLFGANPTGAAQKEYATLDEIRADEDRLQQLPEDEYDKLKEEASDKLRDVCSDIVENNPSRFENSFGAVFDVGGYIAEVLNDTRNKNEMQQTLQEEYGVTASDSQMDRLMEALDEIANLPTGYFEAKPRRAVGFDEVKAAIIPNSLDGDIKEGFSDRGIAMYEYDPEIEGERLAKVNEAASEQDIRFNISEDTSGNKLSEGQQTYFNNSKIVDADGRLKVMYHGTPNKGFTVFDLKKSQPGTLGRGFYFTDSTSHSGHYGDAYEVYLNIENPLQANTNNITKDQIKAFVQALADNEDYGLDNYGYDATVDSVVDSVWGKSDFAMIRDLNLSAVGDMAEALRLFNYTNGTDYDGIVTDVETLAMRPEQIKLTSNLNPTANEDIRFSVSDDDYMEAVNQALALEETDYFEYMKAIRAIEKMVDRAAMEAGYGTKAYHGTKAEPFNVFKRDYIANGRLYGDGFYFSPLEDIALSYGETRPFYLKTNDVSEDELGWDTLAAKEHRYFDNREEAIEFFNDKYQNFVDYGQGIERFRPEADVTEDGKYKVSYTTVGAFEHGFIMVATEPEYIKSAEPIVRDDAGNVIPISKRFNDHNIDTRFSIPDTDAGGNPLTVEQRAYFDGSKAVDEQGRLLRLYHGTSQAGFTVFSTVWESGAERLIWMTTSRRDADAYGGDRKGRTFDPEEKEQRVPAFGGNYRLDNPFFKNFHFDSEEDMQNFVDAHPDIDKVKSDDELYDLLEEGKITESDYNRLNRLGDEIKGDYRKYEYDHMGRFTWGDLMDNPEKFNKEDFYRAILAWDSNASVDDMDDAEIEDFLATMQEEEELQQSEGSTMRDLSFLGRIPEGEESEYVYPVNNRTYELYANLTNPLIVDMFGKHMADGGYAYVDEMRANNEYDGIVIKNTAVGMYADPQTIVIAKESNQVKDVNNTDPSENPDIRYSITDDEEAKSRLAYEDAMDDSYEALERYEQLIDMVDPETYNIPAFQEENVVKFYASLKADEAVPSDDPVLEEDRVRIAKSKADFYNSLNAKWQDRWTTGGEVLDVKSVKKDIRNLVIGVMNNSDTSAKYRNEIVKKTLMDVRTAFQLMKQDRSDIASYLLYHSAQRMIDNVEFYTDDTFDMYKDLKHYLRTTRISLGEEYWSDVDYNAFRKRNFGRLKLVKGPTNVDEIYQELQGRYPEWFDEDETMSVPDQLLEIEHVLDSIQPYKEAYSSEAAAELAFDIADELYDIMAGGKEIRSLADTYKERYDAKTKAMKQRHAEAMLRMRKAKEEGVQAERAKWQAREAKTKERTAHKTYFDRVQKVYDKLKDRLITNTADLHIPEQYKKDLARLLAAFDMQTVGSKKREERTGHVAQKTIRMGAIKEALKNIERTSEDFYINDTVTDIIDTLLGEKSAFSPSIDGKAIDELSAAELKNVYDLLRSLLHELNNFEKVRAGMKNLQAQDLADAQGNNALAHAEEFGKGEDYRGPLGVADTLLNMDEVTPAYLFRQIDPDNVGLGVMWKELRRCQDRYIRNTDQLNKWIDEIVGKYHNKNITKHIKGYGSQTLNEWRSSNYIQTFQLENGTIALTPAQMMSLYCLSKRPQAYGHMVGAGVVVAPVSFQAKIMSDKKEKVNRALPTILTDADIKFIVSYLTPEQINVADKLQELMATKMAAWGNEASMNVIGIELFKEKEYFPIRSDQAGLTKDLTNEQFENAIRSFGFTKAVQPDAKNAIMIDDIFDVVTEHCNNMNLYNSYSEVLNDFNKVLNKSFVSDIDGHKYKLRQALRDAYSQKAVTYITEFIRDVNGNTSRGRQTGIENALQGLLGNAKKSAVFTNIRVLLQQPTALTRAFYVIDPKYLKGVNLGDAVKGMIPFVTKQAMQEMFEHCPIALWKSWGYYDFNMGKSIEDIIMNEGNHLEDIATGAYGAADNVTWTAIWQMVKAEMKDTHPDVKEGTDEYWDLCNERMSEIVDLTQVVDSPLHRSHAMRAKGFTAKALTSFMAEPTLTFNMVRDGYLRHKEAAKRGEKGKAASIMTKTLGVFALQAVTVSAAAAIADAFRKKNCGDDDDKDFKARWWINFIENLKDELNPLNKIYYAKDIYNLAQGWDYNNLAFQGWDTMFDGFRQLNKKLYEGSETSWWTIHMNIFGGIGSLLGVPVKTLMKDGRALLELFGVELPENLVGKKKTDAVVPENSPLQKTRLFKDKKSDGKGSASSLVKVSTEDRWYDYGNNPITVKDGSPLDGLLNHFGINLTAAEKNAIAKDQQEQAMQDKAAEINEKYADLSGDERDKKVWSSVSTYFKDEDADGKAFTELVADGDYVNVNRMRRMYLNAGGDLEYFNERVMKESKSALKKSIKYDQTDREISAQENIKDYLLRNGMTEDELSEIAYKSDTAKDVKVAMKLNDEEAMRESLIPLINAGLSYEDYERLWENRNRIQLKSYKGRYKDQLKSTGTYDWPVTGPITSEFTNGQIRTDVNTGRPHEGLDIGASMGDPIGAADGGQVIYAGWDGGFGKCVRIQHDDGTVTEYAHMSWWDVNVGDTVAKGQIIGNVGSTGNSTGPHLHFGVIKNDAYVNPIDYLS